MVQLSIKLIFEAGTVKKSPEQPIFAARKTVFLQFFKLYFIFFHEILHTDVKWQYLKCDGARFSKKHFFPSENAGNIPEKPDFWHFFEISSIVFTRFLRKTFFRPKIPEICRKSPFLHIFIGPLLYLVFSHKL